MSGKDFLKDALDNALTKALDNISQELLREAYKIPPVGKIRYSAFTEYGNPPIQGEVIDSTATVIDDEIIINDGFPLLFGKVGNRARPTPYLVPPLKALPEPKEKER